MNNFRLGRLSHNPDAVAVAPRIMSQRFAAVLPPRALDRSGIDFRPRMFSNDALPDCSAAGMANAMLAVGALAGFEPVIDDAFVPTFYASVAGVDATTAAMAATDGVRLLDALQRQERDGFDVGQQVRLNAVWGVIPCGRVPIAQATDELGFAYIGVTLYERDMEGAAVLDDDGRDPGAIVGGHCGITWDYLGLDDLQTGRVTWWGGLQVYTQRWMKARLREAYGVWWRQLLPAAEGSVDAERMTAAGMALEA